MIELLRPRFDRGDHFHVFVGINFGPCGLMEPDTSENAQAPTSRLLSRSRTHVIASLHNFIFFPLTLCGYSAFLY